MAHTHRALSSILRGSNRKISPYQLLALTLPLTRPHHLRTRSRQRHPHAEHPRLHPRLRTRHLRPHEIQSHRNFLRLGLVANLPAHPLRLSPRPHRPCRDNQSLHLYLGRLRLRSLLLPRAGSLRQLRPRQHPL